MEWEFIMIIAVVAIGCTTGLISSWIKHQYKDGGVDQDSYNQLAQAFIRHKKEMQQRVSNLEEMVADKKGDTGFEQIEAPHKEHKLTNHLREKNKVRS